MLGVYICGHSLARLKAPHCHCGDQGFESPWPRQYMNSRLYRREFMYFGSVVQGDLKGMVKRECLHVFRTPAPKEREDLSERG